MVRRHLVQDVLKSIDKLEQADADDLIVLEVFQGIGVPEKDAKICADVLIAADLKGIDSHGINRLKPIYYERIKAGIQQPITRFEVIREGPTTAVIDGNNGMGMVISKRGLDVTLSMCALSRESLLGTSGRTETGFSVQRPTQKHGMA